MRWSRSSIDDGDRFELDRALRVLNEVRRGRGDVNIYLQKRGPEPSGRSTYLDVPDEFLSELQRLGIKFEIELF